MKKTIKLLVIIFLCHFLTNLHANVGMPGIYSISGGLTFVYYNPDEEFSSSNIEMKEEKINILLYQSFAVIKCQFFMINDSGTDIKLNTGFPKNELTPFRTGELNPVFEKLYSLKIEIDGKLIDNIMEKENWYIWETDFPKNKETIIKVYYILDCRGVVVKKGYHGEQANGFCYIVESGKVWKDKIGKAGFYIKLMENLKGSDIFGFLPDNFLYSSKYKTFFLERSDFEPSSDSNIILKYKKNEILNIPETVNNSRSYYKIIDSINFGSMDKKEFKKKANENVFHARGIDIVSIIFFAVILSPIILIIIIVTVIILIAKFYRKKKK